jgi:hypothetical protein
MPKFIQPDAHHQPRKSDKKKRHQRGFNEDSQDHRAARISFKKYMQQLEEEEQYDDDEFGDE